MPSHAASRSPSCRVRSPVLIHLSRIETSDASNFGVNLVSMASSVGDVADGGGAVFPLADDAVFTGRKNDSRMFFVMDLRQSFGDVEEGDTKIALVGFGVLGLDSVHVAGGFAVGQHEASFLARFSFEIGRNGIDPLDKNIPLPELLRCIFGFHVVFGLSEFTEPERFPFSSCI